MQLLACASSACPFNTAVAVASRKEHLTQHKDKHSGKSRAPATAGHVGEVPVEDKLQCCLLPVGRAG